MADIKFSALSAITARSGIDYVIGQKDNGDGTFTSGKVAFNFMRGFGAVNAQTAAYTAILDDAGKLVKITSATAVAFTIPTNATVAIAIGDMLAVYQGGAGGITFTAASGVTLRTPFGAATTALYDIRIAVKVATDEWVVM